MTLIYYCNDLFYASLNTNLLQIVITNSFHRESEYKKYCVWYSLRRHDQQMCFTKRQHSHFINACYTLCRRADRHITQQQLTKISLMSSVMHGQSSNKQSFHLFRISLGPFKSKIIIALEFSRFCFTMKRLLHLSWAYSWNKIEAYKVYDFGSLDSQIQQGIMK